MTCEKTKKDNRREFRFYTCLILGFTLMLCGFFAPPMGEIHNSVLVGAGMLLCIGALAVGIDLVGCIRELRLLKTGVEDDLKKPK
jgi:hypothetical protein